MKRIKALTQEQVEEVGELILMGNLDALKQLRNDSSAPVLKVCVASVAINIIKRGDMQALNVLLDRLVGKIPTRHETDLEFKLAIIRRVESSSEEEIAKSLPAAMAVLGSGDTDGSA